MVEKIYARVVQQAACHLLLLLRSWLDIGRLETDYLGFRYQSVQGMKPTQVQ